MAAVARTPEQAPAHQPVAPRARAAAPPRREHSAAVRAALLRDTPPPLRVISPDEESEIDIRNSLGTPLRDDLRASLEATCGVDLSPVRIHTSETANRAAQRLEVFAFAYGTDIYLANSTFANDRQVLTHEVAHVIQQQGTSAIPARAEQGPQPYSPWNTGGLEGEANAAARSAASGHTYSVQGRTPYAPQGFSLNPVNWVVAGGRAVARGARRALRWVADRAWDILEQYAPNLVPILRRGVSGVFDWIKERITGAFREVVDTLTAPFRYVTGVARSLVGHFQEVLTWMREAAAQIARGDCRPLIEAAHKIERVVGAVAAPVIARVRSAVDSVTNFFRSVWARFGAPAWSWLQNMAGRAWTAVQNFFTWCWERTAPIREMGRRAWNWVTEKLGVGAGEGGSNSGLLGWLERKANAAWTWVQDRIRPFKDKILTGLAIAGGVAVMLSPAGPFILFAGVAMGLVRGAMWIRQHLVPNNVVNSRDILRTVVIPTIQRSVAQVVAFIRRMSGTVIGAVDRFVAHIEEAHGTVAGSIVSFLAAPLRWLLQGLQVVATWATEKVGGLATAMATGLGRLLTYLEPVLGVLRSLFRVLGNLLELPLMLMGRVWRAIPECIRTPFVNFLVTQILNRIPIFRDIANTPEAWSQMATEVLGIVRMVFRNFDLVGAMRATFRLLLRVLRVPVALMVQVLNKAAQAWDAIFAAPIRFLRSILRAMWQAFTQFFRGIVRHLLHGVTGWLTMELQDVGIRPPENFTSLSAIFGFVLDVLGISLEHIFQLLERRLTREQVQTLRRVAAVASGAWEWLRVAITEGPAGVWRMLVERLRDLGARLLDAAIEWIMSSIIGVVSARLLTMLDPTGIMAVVNSLISLYQAIQSFMRHLTRILEIINGVLDTVVQLAAGNIGPAANQLESAMHNAMPVIISFLANQAFLSGLGRRMREIIGAIRERVDRALLWIIDRALAIGRAFLTVIRTAGRAGPPLDDSPQGRESRKQAALREVREAMRRGIRRSELVALLGSVRDRFALRRAELVRGHDVVIENSPPEEIAGVLSFTPDELARATGRREAVRGGRVEFRVGTFNGTVSRNFPTVRAVLRGYVGDQSWPEPHNNTPETADRPESITANLIGRVAVTTSRIPRETQTQRTIGHLGDFERALRANNQSLGHYYEGGHVIGHQFGGEETYSNLVPMLASLNRQLYLDVESFVDTNLPQIHTTEAPHDMGVALTMNVSMTYDTAAEGEVWRLARIVGGRFAADQDARAAFGRTGSDRSWGDVVRLPSRVPTGIRVRVELAPGASPTGTPPTADDAGTTSLGALTTAAGAATATRSDPVIIIVGAAPPDERLSRRRRERQSGGGQSTWTATWSFAQPNS